MRRSTPRSILACLIALHAFAPASPAAEPQETQEQRFQRAAEAYLRQFPDADTDGDGVLTREEYSRHAVARQKAQSIAELGDRVRVVEDVGFASVDGTELRLDLYLPTRTDAPPPLVVWIHGGGWHSGSKDRCLMTWLVGDGYAVASVEYRLTGVAKFPAQIHDCKGALRWLRAHAGEYGYDPNRLAVAGESAGGHLAALVGTSGGVAALEGDTAGHADRPSTVRAVVDFYGPTDFPRFAEGRESPPSLIKLFGKPVSEARALAELASPTQHISDDDPPVLIVHGTQDTLVPLDQSRRLHDLYRDAGLTSRLVVIPGAGHTGPAFTDDERRAIIRTFLDLHLKATP